MTCWLTLYIQELQCSIIYYRNSRIINIISYYLVISLLVFLHINFFMGSLAKILNVTKYLRQNVDCFRKDPQGIYANH